MAALSFRLRLALLGFGGQVRLALSSAWLCLLFKVLFSGV